MTENAILSFEDVGFDYSLKGTAFTALKDINLQIHAGEFVAIIGASGSGKTTLLNLIGLMASPTRGRIKIRGEAVERLPADQLAVLRNRRLGFIFQHFHLLPRQTVLENVMLPTSYLENAAPPDFYSDKAIKLLARFGLADQMNKRPAHLSGGQKQRTAMCRALLLDPDIILADEPTGALDSKNTKMVIELLEQLNREGRTVIIITHDAKVAAHARRIIRLKDGEIVEDHKSAETDAKDTPVAGEHMEVRSAGFIQRASVAFARFFKIIKTSFESLAANRARTFFTMLGLMIGVLAIIVMITLSTETSAVFKHFFDTKGGRQAFVRFDWTEADRTGAAKFRGFHVDRELKDVDRYFASYGKVEAEIETDGCNVRSTSLSSVLSLTGVYAHESFANVDARLDRGRWIRPNEYASAQEGKVAIIGSDVVDKLFPKEDIGYLKNPQYPLGELIYSTGGCSFEGVLRVVGILKSQDTTFSSDANSRVYVPTITMLALGVSPYSRDIEVTPADNVSPTWLAGSVKNYLTLLTRRRYPLRFFAPEQQIERINMMIGIFQGLTIVIGVMCTIIGGIGVMNIMLVNIAERVREIGLCKAVGAQSWQIKNQILLESLALCLTSGGMGVVAGTAICNVTFFAAAHFLPNFVEYHFLWNWTATLLALGTSALSGIAFGTLPASRAAELDIVEALRMD